MHKLLSLLLATACFALSVSTSAQTAAPAQPTTQPAAAATNTDKAVAPEQGKASKKGKKKKLKKKKARHAKAQQ